MMNTSASCKPFYHGTWDELVHAAHSRIISEPMYEVKTYVRDILHLYKGDDMRMNYSISYKAAVLLASSLMSEWETENVSD